jgi:GT2 family glycosyltransferase
LDLSIIIVNWNSAALLRECLASIYATKPELAFETIVVDNASFDAAAGIVQNEFPAVKFIQSQANLGFSKANNLGASMASGRNLLFLNPDTEIVGDALQQMSRFLDATPDAAIAGCKLLNTDLSVQTSCVQSFPSILNQALDAEVLRNVFPNSDLWGMQAIFHQDGDQSSMPMSVEVISGACLMIKAKTFSTVGQFSSNYFMYAEDADLCFKTTQAGLHNYYLSEISVVHHGGGSSDTKPASNFAPVMMRESLLEFMRLRRGPIYAAAYQCTMFIMAALRLTILALAFPFAIVTGKRCALRNASAKWFSVLRWAAGMEPWAKQLA